MTRVVMPQPACADPGWGHACPVDGCHARIPDAAWACDRHWRMLPRYTQHRLLQAVRCGWAETGGRCHDEGWWAARALREIDAASKNRDRQIAARQVAS